MSKEQKHGAVQLVEDESGTRGYFVNEAWALAQLPELAAQLDTLVNRQGTPEKKLGMTAVTLPEDRDKRGGVMMIFYPPTELRGASFDTVLQFLGIKAHSILSGIAREIYQSYTADPVGETSLRNLQTELNRRFGA